MNAFWELLLSPMCCVTAVLCQVFISSLIFFVTHPVIKAWPNNYGNKVPALDVQWHSKLLCNMAETLYFWRKGKLELPRPCANPYDQSQLQPNSLYCIQS